MSVQKLAQWFWGEILQRPMEDCYSKPEFKICLRHASILLKDGLDEETIKRTLLAMQGVGKSPKVLTSVRWESKAGSGESFYALATGGPGPVPCYDIFGQLLSR